MPRERFIAEFRASGTRRIKRDIGEIGRQANATRRTLAFLRSALVVIASARVIQGFTDLIDQFSQQRNLLRQITTSTQQLNAVQRRLFQISQQTRSSLQANVTFFNRLARSTSQLNLTFGELFDLTRTVSETLALSSAGAQEASNALIQFAQGLSAGALQGEELLSVSEQLPKLASIIGEEFGVAAGQLRALNEEQPGIFTTERIIKALREEAENISSSFENATVTISQGFLRVRNALTFFLGGLNDASGVAKTFAGTLTLIAENIDRVIAGLTAFAGIVAINVIVAQLALFLSQLKDIAAFIVAKFAATLVMPFVRLAQTLTAFTIPVLTRFAQMLTATVIPALSRFATALIATAISALRRFATALTATAISALSRFATALTATAIPALRRFAAVITAIAIPALFQLRRAIVVTTATIFVIGAVVPVIATLATAFTAAAAAAAAFTVASGPVFVILSVIVATVVAFKDEIGNLIEQLGGLRQITDNIVTAFLAGLLTIIDKWRSLPAAFADIAIQAGNALISNIEEAVNEVVGLINNLPGVDVENSDLGRLPNRFAGVAADIVNNFESNLEEINRKGGGIDVLKKGLEDALGFLKEFTSRSFLSGEQLNRLRDALLDVVVPGQVFDQGEENRALEKAQSDLDSLINRISPYQNALSRVTEAEKAFTEAKKQGAEVNFSQAEALRRVRREIVGVGNAETKLQDQQELLNKAFEDGIISAKEFKNQLRENRIDFLETQRDFESGFERAFLKFQRDASDSAKQAEQLFNRTFSELEDVIVEFVKTGKLEFTDLVDTILNQLTRLAVQGATNNFANLLGLGGGQNNQGGNNLIADLAGSLFGGGGVSADDINPAPRGIGPQGQGSSGGGFFSSIVSGGRSLLSDAGSFFGSSAGGSASGGFFSNIAGSLPFFAEGGSFDVNSQNSVATVPGIDNRVVAFRANDDERVTVSRDGEGSGKGPVNITFNVQTQDADSFNKSRSQIMTDLGSAVSRAQRRNA